jgi:Zn finger protein HypA/HybF involved in hydrogenase expression
MDALMLDGNAVAGLLQEVFAVEMTTAIGTCSQCGASEPIGAVQVFIGAGAVLRCPHCDNTLVKITRGGERMWLSLPGVRSLELRT